MSEIGSTLPRRQLGRYLREARESIGLTLEEAARLMEWSKSSLQRLEKGHNARVRVHDIALLCEFYRLDTEMTTALRGLAEQTAVQSWWHEYGAVIPASFNVYLGLESSARDLKTFQCSVLPGLLQTPAYSRALDTAFFVEETPEEIEQRVQLRHRRQGIITRKRCPAKLTAILHESVLRTVIGSGKVMAAQLRHVADLGTQPNVDVHILPFQAGLPTGAPVGPFVLLDYGTDARGNPEEPTVAFVQNFTGGMYLEKEHDIAKYRDAYKITQQAALAVRPSRDLLREVAREFDHGR